MAGLLALLVAGCSSSASKSTEPGAGQQGTPSSGAASPAPSAVARVQPALACSNFRIEAPRMRADLRTLGQLSGDRAAARADLRTIIQELRDWTAAAKSTAVGGDLGSLLGDLSRLDAALAKDAHAVPAALTKATKGVEDLSNACAHAVASP
jgi:hypothetical protein